MTVNLGPTFLSGALAANAGAVMDEPSCPLVQVRRGAIMERCHLKVTHLQGPYRHYVLNVIWIFINSLSILLTIYHLHRLYKDYTRTGRLDTNLPQESIRVNKLYTASKDIDTQVRSSCPFSLLRQQFSDSKTQNFITGEYW